MNNQKTKFSIIVFPGTNCEHDCYYALTHILNAECSYVWHQGTRLGDCDAVILPGGFSYGDYLRSGAVARFSPIMSAVRDFAQKGGMVIGICNGFQILLEEGLLPGAMLENNSLKFICRQVWLKIENNQTPFSSGYGLGEVIRMPIRHNEGNYYINSSGYRDLLEHNQVIMRYSDKNGITSAKFNPNGSVGNIAGICNRDFNVFGLMPHPEAACENILGSDDGRGIFSSMIDSIISSGAKV
ncbi:MAG: phosphoribosylformylglycinamidine synthase subunit PurQ [Actinomycetota bacterium]|nr:phosphoribosylformylglycinamidine synthase subunit PurQ [Actinomycetota bacterium]